MKKSLDLLIEHQPIWKIIGGVILMAVSFYVFCLFFLTGFFGLLAVGM